MTTDVAYSVRVKTGAGWRSHGRLRLLISVGQDYHEGAKLKAVVDWINRNQSVREVHVSVNDYLQRHNLIAAGLPDARAGALALSEGQRWIERNKPILAELREAALHMTRWRDWFDRPDFTPRLAALTDHAHVDALFEQAIDTDAHALAERKIRRGEVVANLGQLTERSREYVTEELTVFAMQTAELPASEVYPGSNLASAAYLIGRQLPEPIRPLARRDFTRIDFARLNVAPAPDTMPSLRIA